MRTLRASFLLALTLLASLPICCCAFDSADKVEAPTCCHSQQPVEDKVPCDCDEHGDPMEAKSSMDVLPAPVLKLTEKIFTLQDGFEFRNAVALAAVKYGSIHGPPAAPEISRTALEHCTLLAVFLV